MMRRFPPLLRFAFLCFASILITTGLRLPAAAQNTCNLNSAGNNIQHVIYIQFDNVHLRRDNPNVPSDLEQMPNLLNFLRSQGTLSSNHHTPLISHTANDILTSLTGVYPDRHGIAVANSYPVYRPDNSATFASSFFYWTDLVDDENPSTQDFTHGMLAANGKNAPAPWVPFTRAGCDVGAYSTANIVIERTPFDVNKIFGAGSFEANDPNQFFDFAGAAIHCAQGSPLCGNGNTKAVDDLLPDEPGGYNGYQAIFGAFYINNLMQLADLDFNPIFGFNGFSPSASETLGVIATMQEAGIPVTIAYIADAHDDHTQEAAFGPGQAGYVAQLKTYDTAFGEFFDRLAGDGITPANTLFVVTADEGDHFAGGPPSPAGCDGVNVPCTYSKIGEVDLNLDDVLAAETGNTTPFSIHFDMAPSASIIGNPPFNGPVARQLERDMARLKVVSPITGNVDRLAVAMADPVELGLLHMITADRQRTPTFVLFGHPDYFFLTGGPGGSPAPVEDLAFAWNHGGIQHEITTTFLGLVGPGVRQNPQGDESDETGFVFSDHTDIRPTILALLGLKDDYQHDGRVLFEYLDPSALPLASTANFSTLVQLAEMYKKINAPVGPLGKASLVVSTAALKSNSVNDHVYTSLEKHIAAWKTRRDSIAGQMKALLEAAAFNGQAIPQLQAAELISAAQGLLNQVTMFAATLH